MRLLPITLLLLLPTLHTWDILFANVFSVGSHQVISVYLANLLADQGHNVTYLSTHLPGSLQPQVVKRELPACTQAMDRLGKPGGNETSGVFEKLGLVLGACERWWGEPAVQELIGSGKQFDLLVTIGMFDTCAMGLGHVLGIRNTVISMPAPMLIFHHIPMLGLPLYASSVDVSDIMIRTHEDVKSSMFARAKSLVKREVLYAVFLALNAWYVEPVLYKNIPDYPGYTETFKRVRLLALQQNSHPLVDGPTPFGPGVLSLGGSLCKPYNPDEIPVELIEFMDSATEGFIYFSFGSVQADASQEETDKWLQVLGSLPTKVVWKRSAAIPDLPPNVRTYAWLPQASLLHHPHLRMFLTHGGCASRYEALCAAVPMLVVPRAAPDQFYTAQRIAEVGLGENVLDLDSTPAQDITAKIMRILGDARYGKRAAQVQKHVLSTRLRDEQVLGYLDMAVEGYSLVPGYQPWYEYFYLDLIGVPVVTVLAVRFFIRRLRAYTDYGVK